MFLAAAESKLTSEPYDYIIAGGGLAGCVLAERLSADGTKRVLVLEAGSPDFNDFFIRMPAGILKLFRGKYDWQYETGGEKACHGRNIYLQRGKVCGNSFCQ
jgi:choline dehydrogenase-like flavoprotein